MRLQYPPSSQYKASVTQFTHDRSRVDQHTYTFRNNIANSKLQNIPHLPHTIDVTTVLIYIDLQNHKLENQEYSENGNSALMENDNSLFFLF